MPGNYLFAFELGEAVHADGGRFVGFRQGLVAGAGKHEVGRNLNEHRAVLAAEPGQVRHAVAVDAAGHFRLVLGLIHGRVGRAVDDVGRAVRGKERGQPGRVQNVGLRLGQKHEARRGPLPRHLRQALPQLPGGPKNQRRAHTCKLQISPQGRPARLVAPASAYARQVLD